MTAPLVLLDPLFADGERYLRLASDPPGSDAAVLHRSPGESFLHLSQVFRAADGSVVEQVTSLLDPSRFQLHVRTTGRGGLA